MNESTLVPREEMSDLDWLARNVHVWPSVTPKIYPAGCKEFTNGAIFHDEYMILDHDIEITKYQWLTRRAELQNKPSWGKHGWPQIFQNEDGHWFGARAEWDFKAHISGGWKGDGVSLLRDDGEYLRSGTILGDWRDTLEKRPEQDEFVPFVSMEEAAAAKQAAITPSKYTKTIRGVSVDVYDVLQAWGVSNPALQHLIKKALQCGRRGHKDNAQDLQDIIDSAIRAKELES